jgi:TolB-like protein
MRREMKMAQSAKVVNILSPRSTRSDIQQVSIHLIGSMRITAAGADILPRSRKARALLAYLCLCDRARTSRNQLTALLWDNSSDTHAGMSLRHTLSELNREVNGPVPGLVEIGRETVALNTHVCWIDVHAELDHAGPLLTDLEGVSAPFDQWLAFERARFEDRMRTRLEADLKRLVRESALPQVRAEQARKLINFDPTHEGAVRALMTAFAEMGDRPQAIREYERCRQALKSVLDLSPSKETIAVYEAVRLVNSSRLTAQPEHTAGAANLVVASDGRLADTAVPVPDQPSIAVLPFRNLSGNTAHDYAGDGLVEDLIAMLSRVPNFFVISRLSAVAFRNHDYTPQQIAELLGVQYVVSGSMRVLGDRLRLTVELTDSRTGTALWSSRLDERFFDFLEVQDRLADAIVRRLAPYLRAAELKRTRVKRPDALGAYDLFLRAQENMHNSSREVFDSSEQLFAEAISRAPEYAAALAWRAYWHVLRVGQGWSPDPGHDTVQAAHFARLAIQCDDTEPMVLAVHGHIVSYLHKDFDLAFKRFEAALAINPNSAPAWLWSAAAHAWRGDGPQAIEKVNRAIALSPYDPLMYAYSGVAGMAYLADAQYERAIEYALRCMRENATYTHAYRLLAIASVLAGQEEQARSAVRELLRLETELTVERFRKRYPGSGTPGAQIYCDALARAGVPLR